MGTITYESIRPAMLHYTDIHFRYLDDLVNGRTEEAAERKAYLDTLEEEHVKNCGMLFEMMFRALTKKEVK